MLSLWSDLKHLLLRSGVGKIKNRDNAALWGTDSEHKLRNPDDPFYKKFAAECSRVQIAVDVFVLGCVHVHLLLWLTRLM